jgi:hypothetical protein
MSALIFILDGWIANGGMGVGGYLLFAYFPGFFSVRLTQIDLLAEIYLLVLLVLGHVARYCCRVRSMGEVYPLYISACKNEVATCYVHFCGATVSCVVYVFTLQYSTCTIHTQEVFLYILALAVTTPSLIHPNAR